MHRRTVSAVALAAFFSSTAAAQSVPDLEIQKTVNTPTPTAGQPVEFTITVRNVGTASATDVHVHDLLPPGLSIPLGMAAFPGSGSYDATTGDWAVGDLAAGVSATLVVPAIISTPDPPTCVVNTAEVDHAADLDLFNDRASVGVRYPDAGRCVDLAATIGTIRVGSGQGLERGGCGTVGAVEFKVFVTNSGSDAARNVVVNLSQNPVVAPKLRFTDASCAGARCVIGTLGPGESVMLSALSDDFHNSQSRDATLALSASTSDPDYWPADNQVSVNQEISPFVACDFGFDEVPGAGAVGCFVATAAYGSALDRHVVTLRHFRDRHLRHAALGRAFIRLYYRHSPPLAKFISEHEALRATTRVLLTPLVLALAYPYRALAVCTLTLLLVLACLIRARNRNLFRRL